MRSSIPTNVKVFDHTRPCQNCHPSPDCVRVSSENSNFPQRPQSKSVKKKREKRLQSAHTHTIPLRACVTVDHASTHHPDTTPSQLHTRRWRRHRPRQCLCPAPAASSLAASFCDLGVSGRGCAVFGTFALSWMCSNSSCFVCC